MNETISFVDVASSRLKMAEPGSLLIATTSEDDESVGKATAWLGSGPVALSGDAMIFAHTLEPKFVSYFFASRYFQEQKARFLTGAKVRRISAFSLSRIQIPVPPIEVQREIVRILDQFTQLEAELEAELERRRLQFEHYRDLLMTFTEGGRWTTMGEIAVSVCTGATPRAGRSAYYDGGSIPWLRTNEVHFTEIRDTEMKITERAIAETGARLIPANCVIIAISGATAGRSAVNKIPVATNQHCCNFEIDAAKAEYRYVYHWVASKYAEIKQLGRGARADLNVSILKRVPVALPSKAMQSEIVEALDKFESLISNIEIGLPVEIAARRKQYEYYRDQLLTFKELPA